MILFLAFGLALVWGLASGGSLLGFAQFPLRRSWIALAALGLQIYPVYFSQAGGEALVWAREFVLLGSYLLLLVFIWENRTLPGIWLVGAGLTANLAVMLLNGGYMPITREALVSGGYINQAAAAEIGSHVFASKDVLLPAEAIRGWILSDIFVIPPWFPVHSVFSIGDVLISVGIFLTIQYAMRKPSFVSWTWRN